MSDLFQYYTEVFRNMSREPKFDPVMIDLEKHLLKQEEDYIDPRERAVTPGWVGVWCMRLACGTISTQSID